MIATNRNAGLIVSGVLLLALVGCKPAEPPATSDDHAQTVPRDADTPSVAAQPAMPSESGGTTEAVEITRADDGSSVQLRKVDASDPPSAAEPAQPAEPAH
ncbi:hypothetical protein FJU31_01895 [Stenotrophomonas cyclobalanopsidis]|uniref:Secreted protein n=1 Tax=Stenotrophomonas cyclobalanopsidis TaxID=2771362 RepID=A0ABQ6T4U5_9GAMM|nr:hypothetical protein [Stenotrophomonas cyclobalanopsidis]KAA9003642.1 hypothetical protein FJU31_01895 [Stenotrophomonas cyclobalanopsidis]